MNRIFLLALLALTWSMAPIVHGQPQEVSFEQVPLPGGFISNFVTRMAQDPQGFLWLATRAWLIKYDGYETTTYRPNPLDSTSLASSKWVETVYVDRAGTLWVGTYGGGLDRFNPETETFAHYPHDPGDPASLSGDTVTVMLETRDGTFWVGTHQGLNRMDRETGTFSRYRHNPNDPKSLSNDQIRVLYEDQSGTLWIGTGSPWGSESPPGAGGLNRFDPDTETFTRYLHDPLNEAGLIDNHVSAVFEDSRGTFWVGTAGDGLHTMDRQQGTFTRHLHDPADPRGLSMPHVAEVTGPSYVSVVHEDASGALWIGAINGGLSRYDPADGDVVHYNAPPGRLGTTLVGGIVESREGVLWVVTWDGLFKIVRHRRSARPFHLDPLHAGGANSIKSFLEDRQGGLWIGTEASGLSRVDWNTAAESAGGLLEPVQQYLHDPNNPHSLSDNTVLSLHEDSDGVIWAGTDVGLDRLDPESGRFTRYRHESEDTTSLGPGQVFSIREDKQGVLWAGLYGGGISRFDRETGRFRGYRHDPADPNSLSDDDVVVIHQDREGILWIGTLRGGINRFDPQTERFTRYPHPVADSSGLNDGFVTSIHEDSRGILWIGTMLGGLNRFDRKEGRFTHFTTANSVLPDNRVQGILEDQAGDLWVTTGSGAGSRITRFGSDQSRRFTYDPGLFLPSGNALPGRHVRETGELFFGGDNGFIVFSPRELIRNISQNAHAPQVVLTGFRLFNKPIETGTAGPIRNPPVEGGHVVLPHDQNTFTLDFVGLHFENPAENRYSYTLEGYDDEWRDAGTVRQAGYYKVPPGEYVFRVKAANSDGFWTDDATSTVLVIRPPWWRTWWAYSLYGAFVLGGVFTLGRLQRRRVRDAERRWGDMREARLRAELAERQTHNLKVLDEAKSRFFANISHEFRTPLTLLHGPIRDLMDGRIDAARLATYAPVMQRNVRRLLALINQLLDLSRLDAGGMRLDLRRSDLVPFLRRHVLAFTSSAERDGVALVFTAEPERIEAAFDEDKLEKVILNLLSNAFKFTPSGGRVRVMVRQADDVAEITVRDTGEGIAADELPFVFDRFYQADRSSTRRHEGTGIGLSLVKELVELHGGTIDVDSERGFGSTFTVRVPIGLQTSDGDEAAGHGWRDEEPFLKRGHVEVDEAVVLLDTTEVAEDQLPPTTDAPEDALTILIVEDNADMRTYLRSSLVGSYRILEARDGADGLRQAKEHEPDLVIADVMMPLMDGLALCEAIKSDEALNHIPVVLLTAKADDVSRIEGLQTGADAYVAKPFNLEELMARVENLLEVRRRLRERFSDEVLLGPEKIIVKSEDAVFIERVRAVIEAHMSDSAFDVTRMADELELSERQLHRRMKEAANLTPAVYIRMMRLERASQLLQQQAGRVSDVAYAVGFKNAKYFSRLFKQTFGRAPSDHVDADPQ